MESCRTGWCGGRPERALYRPFVVVSFPPVPGKERLSSLWRFVLSVDALPGGVRDRSVEHGGAHGAFGEEVSESFGEKACAAARDIPSVATAHEQSMGYPNRNQSRISDVLSGHVQVCQGRPGKGQMAQHTSPRESSVGFEGERELLRRRLDLMLASSSDSG